MTDTPIQDEAERAGETLAFSTTLRPSRFLMLSLKNGLLNIITLTLYRFWGKTEVRRRVWRGVAVNGDAFEYTGRGLELFYGFLIALLVLGLPFLMIVFGAQFLGPGLAFLIILPMYIFIFWLWGFGVFNAFRYMASRTTWRGVRFRLGDQAIVYGWRYLGMLILGGITFGWFWPRAHRLLAESLWSELRFGNLKFRFSMARSEQVGVYGWFALGWLGIFGLYILVIIIATAIGFAMAAAGHVPADAYSSFLAMAPAQSPEAPPPDFAFFILFYAGVLVLSPFWLLLWAPYQAALLRSIAAGVRLGEATFSLDVKAISLWWLTVSNLAAIIFTLGFLMPWVQARTARFLITRLRSTGTADLDSAQQAGVGPKTGEGLADAFGFSMI